MENTTQTRPESVRYWIEGPSVELSMTLIVPDNFGTPEEGWEEYCRQELFGQVPEAEWLWRARNLETTLEHTPDEEGRGTRVSLRLHTTE